MPEDPSGSSTHSNGGPAGPSSSSGRPAKNQRNNSSGGGPTTSTAGTVRRTPPSQDGAGNDGRPPTKRARKAINCEPCRNSKLKCDRNRPCSSCVLRGTSALCYQDGRGFDESASRGDDLQYARIDPAQEISRLRHSINLLEAYIFPASRQQLAKKAAEVVPKKEDIEPDVNSKPVTHHTGSANNVSAAPGVLGSKQSGGNLYAGSTSLLNLLATPHSEEEESRTQTEEYSTPEYDSDLLALLPPLQTIDELITFYFEFCNWIYRHVNQHAFTKAWQRFKDGTTSDRITLATACVMIAVATYYLPPTHHLFQSIPETQEEIGLKFYDISTTALQRRLQETKTYSMELVELYLIRAMYQTLLKSNSEEIWHIRGELFTVATAMGLHRDPSKWKMQRDVAERRRWAWWHIILLERWQAFLLGRPLTIASHHFDTQLPSYCDPNLDKTGRLYLPNIALFRLAYILGDIMDDAVSVRPVPYESVMANDRALLRWMEELPHELDLDEYKIARSLASTDIAQLRFGVQSVIIRTSYYHIRFTLHRPYASKASAIPASISSSHPSSSHPPSASSSNPGSPTKSTSKDDPSHYLPSLSIAVSSAEKLITMVDQSRPDFLASSTLAVPGHMNWGPWHSFSAAMFFSFQLIANPDQPGAGLFRACIRKAIGVLEGARANGGGAVADKGVDILGALEPLYTSEYFAGKEVNGAGAGGVNGKEKEERVKVRQREREAIMNRVRKLAFPYHDAHDPRRSTDSPSVRGVGSPAGSSSGYLSQPHQQQQQQSQSQHQGMNGSSVSPHMGSIQAYENTTPAGLRTQAAYNNSNNSSGSGALQSPTQGMMMQGHGHGHHTVNSSPVQPSSSSGYHHHPQHHSNSNSSYGNTLPPLPMHQPPPQHHHSQQQQQHHGGQHSQQQQQHPGAGPSHHHIPHHHATLSSYPPSSSHTPTQSHSSSHSSFPLGVLSTASNYGPIGGLGMNLSTGAGGGGAGGPANPVDEMWGAAVGFGQVEWSAFEGAAGRLGGG